MKRIKAMKDHNCKVRAFVTDGMPAQKAAYDPTNKHSIQYSEGGTNRNIFFVYCRCHLINRVIEELIEKTPLMRKAKNKVRDLASFLRKKKKCKKIGEVVS
ncbi:hypothetical protein M9Y10_005155 [Tritrichomonas musculus]|uniref:MULE transposase domain-containing protein n=1 Tax=Tritrichomonas musculus TaxID=1915356 RepID=A0ABR2JL56_9EUKA